MTYKVSLHPSVHKNFKKLYLLDSLENILTLLVFEHYTRAHDMLIAYV